MAASVIAEFEWAGSARLHRYFLCDVFTSSPLEGNQLAVFVDGREFTGEDMQKLARETNLAETVFLFPAAHGGDVRVRIFTPRTELPFAGHPVLGTAFVVASALECETVKLETDVGLVPVRLERDHGRLAFGWMTQPLPEREPFDREGELLRALGLRRSELPIELYRNGPPHVYVALPSEDAVAALEPDLPALARLEVAVNCFAGYGRSWKTRMFYPAVGISEDPATGSAAGPLAIHLARHGWAPFGEAIRIRQGVEIGRPSILDAIVNGDADQIASVEVGGSALIVAEGLFRIS